jgi:hypothetical protein
MLSNKVLGLTQARFNVKYAEVTYGHQPVHNSPGVWKYVPPSSLISRCNSDFYSAEWSIVL